MAHQRRGQSDLGGDHRSKAPSCGPRVVIFQSGEGPQVEVVEVPRRTTIGARICHRGTSWLVTELRTHNRVIICSPAEA